MPEKYYSLVWYILTLNIIWSILLLISDTQRHADEAVKAVKVTYKDQKPLLLTIDEAVAAKSFFDPQAKTLTKGDPDSEYNHQSS